MSKSGTLTYQMMYELRDIGFSTAVGIGGDPIIGTTHIDCLQAFQEDPETDAIVMIGEIGGDAEERAAAYIEANVTKPVVAYVAGFTAPEGKTMGHAGAIISGSAGTAHAKKEALEKVGVKVGRTPSETARLVRELMRLADPAAGLASRPACQAARPGKPPGLASWLRWPAPGASKGRRTVPWPVVPAIRRSCLFGHCAPARLLACRAGGCEGGIVTTPALGDRLAGQGRRSRADQPTGPGGCSRPVRRRRSRRPASGSRC